MDDTYRWRTLLTYLVTANSSELGLRSLCPWRLWTSSRHSTQRFAVVNNFTKDCKSNSKLSNAKATTLLRLTWSAAKKSVFKFTSLRTEQEYEDENNSSSFKWEADERPRCFSNRSCTTIDKLQASRCWISISSRRICRPSCLKRTSFTLHFGAQEHFCYVVDSVVATPDRHSRAKLTLMQQETVMCTPPWQGVESLVAYESSISRS